MNLVAAGFGDREAHEENMAIISDARRNNGGKSKKRGTRPW
jgi:hypothetical protein